MSIPEVVYRAHQWRQARTEKRSVGCKPSDLSCKVMPSILPRGEFRPCIEDDFDIYGIQTDPSDITDWSKDISSGKSFPAAYSRHLNIRNDRYGSARHVWELNRMLFLPRFALLYKESRKPYFLGIIKRSIIEWTSQNPYLAGINWYSNIEVNIRLINWFLTWEILEADKIGENDASFMSFINHHWLPSIYQHCQYSRSHPSLHSSSNNHLIAEYSGLFIASCKWHFQESEGWNSYARLGLEKEIVRQHSGNGINKEQAAGYIQFIADFLLLPLIVARHIQKPFSKTYEQRFLKILDYIQEFLTIKGDFPKYGDEDDGRVFLLNPQTYHDNNFNSLLQSGSIYYNLSELNPNGKARDQKNTIFFGNETPAPLGSRIVSSAVKSSKFYPDEGHFIFRRQGRGGQEIYCYFDAAPLGYLSIAAHGHADALSFMLYVDGYPFFVDPGTYCYHTEAKWRQYFVSTLAHNTVCISGENQANFVGPTLWHDHYRTQVSNCLITNDHEYVVANHDGYKKLNCTHTRKIEFFPRLQKFSITDHVTNSSGRPVTIQVPFHLHPGLVSKIDLNHAEVKRAGRSVLMELDTQLKWQLIKARENECLGWYSDRFSEKVPSSVILGSLEVDKGIVITTDLVICHS